MLDKLGAAGIVGLLLVLGGLGLVAYVEPIIAAGIALVLAGLGLTLKAIVSSFVSAMGLGGAL
jgi:hypothetical protein